MLKGSFRFRRDGDMPDAKGFVGNGGDAPEGAIGCVFLTCFESAFTHFANILRYSEIHMHHAGDIEEADFLLTVTGSTVLLTDIVFAEGTWADVLAMAVEVHPLVAALVVADDVDRDFVADALNRGACGILWKHLDLDQIACMIRAAHEAACQRVIRHNGRVAA